jgi:predicted transcriptional regulator of viral defense system
MDEIIKILIDHKGYARMMDLKKKGIHTRTIKKAVDAGILEKIKPGLYKLIDYPWDEHENFVDIFNANNNSIICLISSAAYWELTTFNPNQIDVAVPHSTDKFQLKYPPIKVYYYVDKFYKDGIETIKTKSGKFKIYNKEKTICDLFRYQKKIGEDITIESLKTYISNRKFRRIPKLLEYAERNNVTKKIEPLLKGML